MPEAVGGIRTVVLTDVVGSTPLWDERPMAAARAFALHDELVRAAVERHGGQVLKHRGEGDSTLSVHVDPSAAIAAALDLQRAVVDAAWPADARLEVRVGVHVGEVVELDGELLGTTLNRCARIRGLADAGQVLLSAAAAALASRLEAGATVVEVGEVQLKGLRGSERLFQAHRPDLSPAPWVAPTTAHRLDLPPRRSVFGRAELLEHIGDALGRGTGGIVTLVGPGGVGKTTLAVEAAWRSGQAFDRVLLCHAEAVVTEAGFLSALAATVGCGADLDELTAALGGGGEVLLVVDNLEQAPDAWPVLESLLSPEVRVLVTSRRRLGLRSEQVVPVGALDPRALGAGVELFRARAESVRPGSCVTDDDLACAQKVVAAVEGLPLAIELAAARVSALSLPELAERVVAAGGVLGGRDRSRVDASLELSWGLLEPPARLVLARATAFVADAPLRALEAVVAKDGVELADVVDLVQDLVDASLLEVRTLADGRSGYHLHPLVRAFAAARLDEPDGRTRWRHGMLLAGTLRSGGFDGLGARHFVDDALACLQWLADAPWADGELAIGIAFSLIGLVEVIGGGPLVAPLLRILERAPLDVDRAATRERLAMQLVRCERYDEARAVIAVSLAELESADGVAALTSTDDAIARFGSPELALAARLRDVHWICGHIDFDGDPPRAQRHYELCHEQAVLTDDHYMVALSLNNIGLMAWAQDDLEASFGYLRRAVAWADQHDVAGVLATASNNLLEHEVWAGRAPTSGRDPHALLARVEGDPEQVDFLVWALARAALADAVAGDDDAAEQRSERLLALANEAGGSRQVTDALRRIARIRRVQGRFDEAVALTRRALDVLGVVGPTADGDLAWSLAGRAAPGDAEEVARIATLEAPRHTLAAAASCVAEVRSGRPVEALAAVARLLAKAGPTDVPTVAVGLRCAALAAADMRRSVGAARCMGAVESLERDIGDFRLLFVPTSRGEREEFATRRHALCAELGPDAFDAALAEGRAAADRGLQDRAMLALLP